MIRRRSDGAFTLLEVMISLAILAGVTVSALVTITTVESRNRQTHLRNVAHLAAQHMLSTIEASAAVTGPTGLLLQDGNFFEIQDASYAIDPDNPGSTPELFANRTEANGNAPGRIYVYDISSIPASAGRWATEAGASYLVRVSIDVDNDQIWNKSLDAVDAEDVTAYNVMVF